MSFPICLILVSLLLACFSPMFLIHGRRMKALRKLKFEADSHKPQDFFSEWKSHVENNITKSNGVACCIAAMPLPPLIGPGIGNMVALVLLVSSLVLAYQASNHTAMVNKLAKQLGFPKGYGWIGKKQKSHPIEVPAPSEVDARSVLAFSMLDKQVIREVLAGSSVEHAAVKTGRTFDQAREIYDSFYSAYSALPEDKRAGFVKSVLG